LNFGSHGIPALYTTTESSVNVRNRERDGSITLTAELEADAEASLADSDRTDASDLKDKAIATSGSILLQERRA